MDTLDLITLCLSLATLIVAVLLVYGKPRSEDTGDQQLEALSTRVQEIQGLLSPLLIPVSASEGKPKAARKTHTSARNRKSAHSAAEIFDTWYEAACAVRRQDVWSQRFDAFRNSFGGRLAPDGSLDQQALEQLREIAAKALHATDKDLDSDGNNALLQSSLSQLVAAAQLQFVDPQPGSSYTPPRVQGSSRQPPRIRVGRVLTRGLQSHTGELWLDPEIEEAL